MAESFGDAFTLVEVTADISFAGEPTQQLWIALAKPSQAVALVRAAVPEGWGSRLLATIDPLNEDARKAFEELKLEPGAVHKLPSIVNVASYRPRVL